MDPIEAFVPGDTVMAERRLYRLIDVDRRRGCMVLESIGEPMKEYRSVWGAHLITRLVGVRCPNCERSL